jgi:DNA-binding NarL/FixJ family response regulator
VLGQARSTDIEVNTRRGERKWISLTTLLMPSNWPGLSLLVHLFRDASQSREIRSRLEQELREADPPSEQLVASPLLMPLTPREVEVLRMLVGGASTESICRRLHIGKATVRSHVQHILAKLGVRSRLEAAALAVQHRIV